MGGEKMIAAVSTLNVSGSPPHGRGKAIASRKSLTLMRITPAWAGKRTCSGRTVPRIQDHPRMGGEKWILCLVS